MEIVLAGRRVQVATGGRDLTGDEPAVVFVHGSGCDRTTWNLQTRWFAHHGYRAAAVDLPGHGGSDGPALESVPEIAAWLASAIEVLGLVPAHVVGHSLGCFVALELAATRPEVTRSMVLIGTAATMPVHPDLLAAARAGDPTAGALITSWGVGSRAHRGGHPSPGMWLIGGTRALIDRSPAGSLAIDLAASQAYDAAPDAASRAVCPVTIVLGREDKMTPNRAAADLVAALPGARVEYLDGVGHFLPTEAPNETRRIVAEALAGSSR